MQLIIGKILGILQDIVKPKGLILKIALGGLKTIRCQEIETEDT